MGLEIRPLRAHDWPAVLELANAAVSHLPAAGSQETWLKNRRMSAARDRAKHPFVAEDSDRLVGFGAVESDERGQFRIFIVTRSDDLSLVGELLYSRAEEILREQSARRVWLTEYAADEPLLSFAAERGFIEHRRFSLADGIAAITLKKEFDPGVTA